MAPLISSKGTGPSRWWRNLEHHPAKSKPNFVPNMLKSIKISSPPGFVERRPERGALQRLFVVTAAAAHDAGDVVVVIIVVVGQEGVIIVIGVVVRIVDTGQQIVIGVICQFLVAQGLQ